MSFDQNVYGNVKRLIGHVVLRNENTTMSCDSAYLYDEDQSFEAFSNVKINQADSVTVTAKHLTYSGKDKIAHLDGNVWLVQGKMSLNTERLDYLLKDKKAYYQTAAKISNKESTLTSQKGEYYTSTKEAVFKQRVKLKNIDFELQTDTLTYNTSSEESVFTGPTSIITQTDSIYAVKGWYQKKTGVGRFSRRASVKTGKQLLIADSIYFDQKNNKGYARGNICFNDSNEKMNVWGDEGYYYKNPQFLQINGKARVSKRMDLDTVQIWCDTLYYEGDSVKRNRKLNAVSHVNLYKNDVQAVCDTLCYMIDDSNVSLFKNPTLWSAQNQLTADSIYIFLKQGFIDNIVLKQNGFIVSYEKAAHFNQIKGDSMLGFFDVGDLRLVKVWGNAQSIYYVKEDTNKYIGLNEISCPQLQIYLEQQKVKGIKFEGKSKATLHPIEKRGSKNIRLKGFLWNEKMRPHTPLKNI